MFDRAIGFSLSHRYLVLVMVLMLAAFGIFSLQKLPIDAVPDITNNQVQINTELAGLSPEDIEKQVTFPIESALAGISGLESTRSLSRNGFSQVWTSTLLAIRSRSASTKPRMCCRRRHRHGWEPSRRAWARFTCGR